METTKKVSVPTLPYPDQDTNILGKLGVSVRAFLDTAESRKRKDGTYGVRLRVIHDRNIRLYTVKGVNLTIEAWLKVADLNKKATNGAEVSRKRILDDLKQAYGTLVKMPAFSWSDFDNRYANRGTSFESVWGAFTGHIAELKKRQRFSNAEIYYSALNSFKRFYIDEKTLIVNKDNFNSPEYWERPGRKLLFKHIEPAWLHDYNEWMEQGGRSVTTTSMNVRCLRHLYNLGIDAGEIPKALYPFGSKKKYKPPAHRNNKRALSMNEIRAIYEYTSDNTKQLKYRDLFIFSYISYGLNVADICRMTWKNIDQKYIEVIRRKTQHSDETHTIRILLTDEHKRIIEKHGKGEYYVFDVLKKGDNEETQHKLIKQFTHILNGNIKRLAKQINTERGKPVVDEKISSYFARHSFASIARDAGIPESSISQCMGHSQGFGITGQYFSEVPDSMLQKIARILLPFIFDQELTDLQLIVYNKLRKKDQAEFIKLPPNEREKYVITFLSKRL